MKIKILMFFSVFALLISAISIKVAAFSIVENSTVSEQGQTVWGFGMFDRQRFSSSQNLNEYIYLDDMTYTNRIAFEGGYPLLTGIQLFISDADMSALRENSYMSMSNYTYDFIEGNFVNTLDYNWYYYSYIDDIRAFYFDYASFDTISANLVDLVGLWAYDRYFYWDTLILDYSIKHLYPYLTIGDIRLFENNDLPTITISFDYDFFNYDVNMFEERSYTEEISLNNYISSIDFVGQPFPVINYPLFELLYEFADLPTFITNLEIKIDASNYSTGDLTFFNGFNFSLTNQTDNDLWKDLVSFEPPSIVTQDIDFASWLVRGVSGVFDTELIPGISMGNILKLILAFTLVFAVLRYFVGG